jgi:hypothetical protein
MRLSAVVAITKIKFCEHLSKLVFLSHHGGTMDASPAVANCISRRFIAQKLVIVTKHLVSTMLLGVCLNHAPIFQNAAKNTAVSKRHGWIPFHPQH